MKNAAQEFSASCDQDFLQEQRNLLKSFIRTIMDALSTLEASGDHPFAEGFQTYFRGALVQLDRYEIETLEGIQELAAFMNQIEKVASTFLTLIEQAKLIEPIDRIGTTRQR